MVHYIKGHKMTINIEQEIYRAVEDGILLDKRASMSRGRTASGALKKWPIRPLEKVLGVCIHQNAGGNDPRETAKYHTSKQNHITPGRPLPSICYHLAIPDGYKVPLLVADLNWRLYAQASKAPGDENTHLISILVMGDFDAPGYKGSTCGPSNMQVNNLRNAIEWLQRIFDFGNEGIFGHYHFGKSQCPGYVLTEIIEDYRKDAPDLQTPRDWQLALLNWGKKCLPKWGADGLWGNESKKALIRFQQKMNIQVTGVRDAFTELLLIKRMK
jgi:hypothetical protein